MFKPNIAGVQIFCFVLFCFILFVFSRDTYDGRNQSDKFDNFLIAKVVGLRLYIVCVYIFRQLYGINRAYMYNGNDDTICKCWRHTVFN